MSYEPGWYADPTGRNELRYWDGAAWSEHVSRAGQQYCDPLVVDTATAPGRALVHYLRCLALVLPAGAILGAAALVDEGDDLVAGLVVSFGCLASLLWLVARSLDAVRSPAGNGRREPGNPMVWYLRVLAVFAPILFLAVVDAFGGEAAGEGAACSRGEWSEA